MAIPTAAEIVAIRDKMVQSRSERSVNRWAAEYDEDIGTLLAALDAVTAAFAALRRCATCDRTGGVGCFGYSCEECTLEMTAKLNAVTAERDRLRAIVDPLESLWTTASVTLLHKGENGLRRVDVNRYGNSKRYIGDSISDALRKAAESDREIKACDLKTAYLTVFGGVMACSPDRYTSGLMQVAAMAGRELDDQLRQEILEIQSELSTTEGL